MNEQTLDQLTPKVLTWGGLLFLAFVAGVTFQVFGREIALGAGVGIVIGLANFKAIAFILKRVFGPNTIHKILYGIFGLLKFVIVVSIFFGLIHFQLFDVYGIVGGFSAVLLLVMIEGLIRANRYSKDDFPEEKVNA
jgi:hypothetical protein